MKLIVPPFGDCVQAAREERGLTAADVQRIIGFLPANLSHIERSARSAHWRSVYRLIVGCELGLEYFFPADTIVEAAERIKRIQAENMYPVSPERQYV